MNNYERVELYAQKHPYVRQWCGCHLRTKTNYDMEIYIKEFDGINDRKYVGLYDSLRELNWMPSEFNEFVQPTMKI